MVTGRGRQQGGKWLEDIKCKMEKEKVAEGRRDRNLPCSFLRLLKPILCLNLLTLKMPVLKKKPPLHMHKWFLPTQALGHEGCSFLGN